MGAFKTRLYYSIDCDFCNRPIWNGILFYVFSTFELLKPVIGNKRLHGLKDAACHEPIAFVVGMQVVAFQEGVRVNSLQHPRHKNHAAGLNDPFEFFTQGGL